MKKLSKEHTKELAKLKQKKYREDAGKVIVEGARLIDQLQKTIDARKDYFQLKLNLHNRTNGDNVMDTINIPSCSEEVWLSIDFNVFQGEEY